MLVQPLIKTIMNKLYTLTIAFGFIINAFAQNVSDKFWETNGEVKTTLKINNKLYIGGNFSYVGKSTGNFAGFELSSPAIILNPLNIDGKINTMVRDNAGNIYLGGQFNINGTPRSLVKLLPTMAIDNLFDFNTNGEVFKLLISGNDLFVAGNFGLINSTTRINLAQINLGTNQLTAFSPNPNGAVYDITLHNGNIYAGGFFTIISSTFRNSLAVFNTSGALQSVNIPVKGTVASIVAKDSLLFIGGNFDSIAGVYRKNIGSVNIATGNLRAWNLPVTGGAIATMKNIDNTLYLGGTFTQVSTQFRNYLAGVNMLLPVVTDFDPGVDAAVSVLESYSGNLLMGGQFSYVGFDTKRNFAAIEPSSASLIPLIPNCNNNVNAILTIGDTILLGGIFSSIGGMEVNNIAALDYTTGNYVAWPVNLDGTVNVMRELSGNILLGGNFQTVNSILRNGIALIDTISGTPTAWNANCSGSIQDILVNGTTVYIAGSFNSVSSTTRNNLAAVSANNGSLLSWNPNVNAPVNKLSLVYQSQLYAMGNFTTVNGQNRKRIASFNLANGGVLRSFNANIDSVVNNLIAYNGRLLVGGLFNTINGTNVTRIAEIDTVNGTPTTWQATLNGSVNNFILSSGLLFAGTNTTGNNNSLVCLNVANGQPVSFPVNISSGSISHFNISGSDMIIGGNFKLANTKGKGNLAIINLETNPPTANASALNITNVTTLSMRVAFTSGNGSRRIVLAREAALVDASPVNGLTYTANNNYGSGSLIGNNYVVYDGSGNNFTLSGLNTKTRYHIAVFEYNGVGSFTKYLITNPLRGSDSTIAGYTIPAIQASNITFSNVTRKSITVKFTKGNGEGRYLVAKEAGAVNKNPLDSTNYLANNNFSFGTDLGENNFIIMAADRDSVVVSNLKEGTRYHFSVFEYNGVPLFRRVNITNPGIGNTTTLTLAAEPTNNASGITFDSIAVNSIKVNWINGNGASRLLIASEGNPVSTLVIDGEGYFTDNNFNGVSSNLSVNERVVYIGSGNNVTVKGLKENTTYHFAVIEYNGNSIVANYLTTGFATANAKTLKVILSPIIPSKDIAFTKVTKDTASFTFTKGNGSKRVVFVKEGAISAQRPVLSKVYNANVRFKQGDSLPDGSYAIANGDINSALVNVLKPNTTYFINIYEYNETIDGPVYLTDSFAFKSFTTLPSVGMADVLPVEVVNIYPNPSNGNQLTINFNKIISGNVTVSLSDINGKTVSLQNTDLINNKNTIMLNTSMLNNGVYFVLITTNQGSSATRILINN